MPRAAAKLTPKQLADRKKARRQARKKADAKKIPNDPILKLVVDNTAKAKRVKPDILARSRAKPQRSNSFVMPSYPPGVLPPGQTNKKNDLAMDEQIIAVNAWANQSIYAGAFNNGITFLGYPYLSELSVIPEYRKITETTALHMTRKFIKLKSAGEDDADEERATKIKELTDELDKFKLKDVFRKLAETDGYFGRAHLYIDFGYLPPAEMRMPIGNGRDALSRLKVQPGTLKGFKVIEPTWTYPMNYNSQDPTSFDWYNPQTWFVMQKEIHVSRLLKVVGHEVSDLLKPAFSFGGLSLSQMAKPYVDNWLRTRQSVADLIWSFSVSGVLTDLETIMQADGDALFDRAELFNNLKNNRGMMILNKDSEEFFQVNTPLGTLDKLQAQAQEQMASISSIPLVFLLGITPSGLNASSEGEIRVFYDFIAAYQEKLFKDPLTRCIDFIQLSKYGEIDPAIIFEFEPLWAMTEKEESEIDKTNAETDDLRINGGVISPLEARKGVANAPNSRYGGLRTDVLPNPPGGGEPGEEPEIGGRGLDPGKPEDGGDDEGGEPKHPAVEDDDEVFAHDAAGEFRESDHPRGQPENAGQFGPGGTGPSSNEEISYRKISKFGEYHDIAKASESELSPEEKNAVNFYTSPEYKPLNKSLRSGKKLSPSTQQMVDHLDEAINKSHLSENLELYRTMGGAKTREMLDLLMPGDVLTDHGYSSTSLHKSAAMGGAGKKSTMVIRAPKGANAVFPGENSYNARPNQEGGKTDEMLEAILPRGSQFRFIGKKGATYEFELVPTSKGARDDAHWEESKHPRGQPGNAGQFGPGGGGSAPSPEANSKKHNDAAKKIIGGKAGISNSYRNAIKDLLQSPHVSSEDKVKLKHKMIESYSNKAAQLNGIGEYGKAGEVAKKAAKLAASMGAVAPTPPKPAPSAPASSTKHQVSKSFAQPDKFIVKSPDGNHVLGENGTFGKDIPTKKFNTQAEAEAAAKKLDETPKEPPKPVETPKQEDKYEKKKADQAKDIKAHLGAAWDKLSDSDKDSLVDLGLLGESATWHFNAAKSSVPVKDGKLSAGKAAHIFAYTGSAYAKTNQQLRNNELDEEVWNHVKQLNEALSSLPKYTKPTKRGTKLNASELSKWQPGKIVGDHGFMSTTKDSHPSFGGNVVMTIHGKSGRDISELSHHESENEVLFPAGTKFKIKSRETKGDKTHFVLEEV